MVEDGAESVDVVRTAHRAAELVAGSTVGGQTDVVLLTCRTPAGEWDDTAPFARVVDRSRQLASLAERGPLVIYVRPDGAVGAWSSHLDLPGLVAGVSVLSAALGRAA